MAELSEEEKWNKLEEIFTEASMMLKGEREAFFWWMPAGDVRFAKRLMSCLKRMTCHGKVLVGGTKYPKTFSRDDWIDEYRILGLIKPRGDGRGL